MSRTIYFKFEFSNGALEFLSQQEAIDYCKENNCKITHNGAMNHVATKRRLRDGFVAGYQPQLGMHIGGPVEYAQVLKEKGLVEVGNEKSFNISGHLNGDKVLDEDLRVELSQLGLSDGEINAVDSGLS